MAASYDKNRKKWYCYFRYHHPDGTRERIRIDSPINTRQGASNYEKQVRKEIYSGTFRRTEPLTLKLYANDFIAWCKRENMKPSTLRSYKNSLRIHLLDFFGNVRLTELRQDLINKYVDAKREQGISDKTISNQLGTLKSVIKAALDEQRITFKPYIRIIKLDKQPKDRPFRFIDKFEADKLLKAANERWHPAILLALHTGLRRGEIQALRWQNVDFKNNKIRVERSFSCGVFTTPKHGKFREVPITKTLAAVLSRHTRMLRTDLVFHTRSGKVLRDGDIDKGLRRVCKNAGITPFGWHTLRHTYASWLAQRGVPLGHIKDLLGHSTVLITERYAHLCPSVLYQSVSVLDSGTGIKQKTKEG